MNGSSKIRLTRRAILKGGATTVGLLVLAPAAMLEGCGGEEAPNCASPAGLTPEQRTQRASLTYEDQSPDQARRCELCSLYTAPAGGADCGSCALGLGPVNPRGTCTSFAARA
jgi:hypothetical protein